MLRPDGTGRLSTKDSIAVSVFVVILVEFDKSEANPNNNYLEARRHGLPVNTTGVRKEVTQNGNFIRIAYLTRSVVTLVAFPWLVSVCCATARAVCQHYWDQKRSHPKEN